MAAWFTAGPKLTIDDKRVSHTGNTKGYHTAYGIEKVSRGKHHWKIKIIKSPSKIKGKGCNINIGVASTTKDCNWNFTKNRTDPVYSYYGYSGVKGTTRLHLEKYSESYNEGDTIDVILDVEQRKMDKIWALHLIIFQ